MTTSAISSAVALISPASSACARTFGPADHQVFQFSARTLVRPQAFTMAVATAPSLNSTTSIS
ncbi:hypothetical protein [Phytoactinopolyspora halotolerans]|uniref:Secreted protein n=1 Tax=Phytoactinopolyspora halotolerans TaxID=1981512 RepID=A0A6L9SI79_9ACTN|nr:hypothetical protein [Phytoactinopolyspora halotolerans]NEE04354.1 hypothetical protein [Phytoactinopolyspora halotolerans]